MDTLYIYAFPTEICNSAVVSEHGYYITNKPNTNIYKQEERK